MIAWQKACQSRRTRKKRNTCMSLTPGMNRVSRAEWTKHFNVKAMTRNCLGVTSLANLTLAAPCHKARTLRSFFTLPVWRVWLEHSKEAEECLVYHGHAWCRGKHYLAIFDRTLDWWNCLPAPHVGRNTCNAQSILQSRVTVHFGPAVWNDLKILFLNFLPSLFFSLFFLLFSSFSTGFGTFVCCIVGAAMFDVFIDPV